LFINMLFFVKILFFVFCECGGFQSYPIRSTLTG
jgi:hypothetical protein